MAGSPVSVDVLMQAIEHNLPVQGEELAIADSRRVGLIVVDEVNGFCTPGSGNLAPPVRDAAIEAMVIHTSALAQAILARKLPILMFLDTHEADRPEPPYPPHCIRGTGEERLVPALSWLESRQGQGAVTLIEKDCINGFVGGMRDDGSNVVVDWVKEQELDDILVVGICTDICVMDFVLTALSARNHGVFGPRLRDIFVLAPACATYDLPRTTAESLGRGITASHPQAATHHLGLYFMASRGARIVNKLTLGDFTSGQ